MDPTHINQVAVVLLLLITLRIGLLSKRPRSMKEYALGNKSLNTGVLTLTLLATFIGCSDLDSLQFSFKKGLIDFLTPLCYLANFCFIGLFIAPKMLRFQGCLTAGDVMNQIYRDKTIVVISGLLGVISSFLIVSIQMRAVGEFMGEVLAIEPSLVILMIGVVTVLYASICGMRAVALTDVFQFIALSVALVVITNVLLYETGGVKHLFENLDADKLVVFKHKRFANSLAGSIFWGAFPTFLLTTPIIRIMLASRTKKQTRQIFAISSMLYLCIRVLLLLTALCAISYCRGDKLADTDGKFLGYLINKVCTNSLMRIMLAVGFSCVYISTIDSFLLSIGIVFFRSIVQPLRNYKLSDNSSMKYIRPVTIALGFLSTMVSMQFDVRYHFYSYCVTSYTIFVIPFILGVIGLKVCKKLFGLLPSLTWARWWSPKI